MYLNTSLMQRSKSSPFLFIRHHLLPFLIVFVVPAFSLGFFPHVETDLDQRMLRSLEHQLGKQRDLTPEQQTEALAFWRHTPVSQVMASRNPEAASAQKMFQEVASTYAIFRWNTRVAWVCLLTVFVTLLIVGISVACSFRSQRAQFWSLRIGWPILRTAALLEVLGQGVLLCFLSYWVTAFYTERISYKLILILCCLAALAVWGVLRVMFTRLKNHCQIEGQVLSETDAPDLWQRVRALATRLGVAPPDRIVAGIRPSFFVTEHPVELDLKIESGRTLYLSLPMLKIMTLEEADAVLGHELAHFSGEDTLWSKRISPMLSKFSAYLEVLSVGFGRVVGHFLHLFWKLYQLSLGSLSRRREFRADRIGAEVTSPSAMARALIKVCSYCEYREKSEMSVIEASGINPELQLAAQIEQGYPAFLQSFVSTDQAIMSEVPHPFDSHPPFDQRIQHLGLEVQTALAEPSLQSAVQRSWADFIPRAAEIESALWQGHQGLIQEHQSYDIAWRTQPFSPEEIAQVTLHFPTRIFTRKDGSTVTLEYHQITWSKLPEPILFSSMKKVTAKDAAFRGKLFDIIYHDADGKKRKARLPVTTYQDPQGSLADAFSEYYTRHLTAAARSRK